MKFVSGNNVWPADSRSEGRSCLGKALDNFFFEFSKFMKKSQKYIPRFGGEVGWMGCGGG